MEGATLFPDKSDAQVEAELAQATRQIEMLKTTGAPATVPEEDCVCTQIPRHRKCGWNATLLLMHRLTSGY